MMGLLTSLFEMTSLFERRAMTVMPANAWRSALDVHTHTVAGISVTPDSALRSTAVFACVRIIAETVASLPLVLYRRRRDRGKDRALDHPLYPLLHSLPNPEMTSYTLRETLTSHVVLRGNCFAEIEINRSGEVVALWPLRADRMRGLERRDGQLWYVYDLPGETVGLPASRVFHVRGLSSDGLWGYSPIHFARNAVGLALATEEFGSRFFLNGARPGAVLRHPGKLSDEAHRRLRQSWEARHQGLENAQRIAILEEGMDITEVGIAPEEAQFLETRKFQVTEIARLYRVPPHMVADLDRATFSNVEHLSLEFVAFTLMPWLKRWEQEISRSLLTPSEREQFFAEHMVQALLRGDTQSRYQAYATARQWGWMSADDVRELENLNPLPDGSGQIYYMPLNMVPASAVATSIGIGGPWEGQMARHERRGASDRAAQERQRLMQAYYGLFEETIRRILRRERNDVGNAARRLMSKRDTVGDFLDWLDEFYDKHREFVETQVASLYRSYGEAVAPLAQAEIGVSLGLTPELEAFIDEYVSTFALRHSEISRLRLRQLVQQLLSEGQDPLPGIEAELDGWESRGAETARWESVRYNNALSRAVYLLGGILALRWNAFGESCSFCRALDGVVVGINQNFLDAGEFRPEGSEDCLVLSSNIGHPPCHDGCDCMVTASI